MTLRADRITLDTIPEFTLRQSDAMECIDAGLDPQQAVRRFVAGATAAYAHYIDGDLVCLWGYRWEDYATRKAAVWLLSTEAVLRHKTAFGRASRHLLPILQVQIKDMRILVHNQYHEAVEWLEWLGFKRWKNVTPLFTEMRRETV